MRRKVKGVSNMNLVKRPPHGFVIKLQDIKVGDRLLVNFRYSSRNIPLRPYEVTSLSPTPNAHGYLMLPGVFLLTTGRVEPSEYAVNAKVIDIDGEQYVLATPYSNKWAEKELKKAQKEQELINNKIEWLNSLQDSGLSNLSP